MGFPGDHSTLHAERENGSADLYLESARLDQIMVALTVRGRKRQHVFPEHEHEDQGPRA
jgi:hypothetical protein